MINSPLPISHYYLEDIIEIQGINGVSPINIPDIEFNSPCLPITQISVQERLKTYTDEINKIISSIENEREEYEMKRFVEMELAKVLGLYLPNYKEAKARQSGYMPSQ